MYVCKKWQYIDIQALCDIGNGYTVTVDCDVVYLHFHINNEAPYQHGRTFKTGRQSLLSLHMTKSL